jgi:AcrR family transcriptional regulator
MSPRPYRMVARRATADITRDRVVAAARRLLSARGGLGAFTIDAVAAQAGVARMTVYHQFESKTGLIEAVFDSLAIVRRGVDRLVAALALADPAATLEAFVESFADVWEEDRLVIHRLAGLAALDPEFGSVWQARESRRRNGLREIATRIAAVQREGVTLDVEAATAALYAIVSPEGFEALAGSGRTFGAVAPLVLQLARKSLGLDGSEPVRLTPPPQTRGATTGPARRRRPRGNE